MGFVPCSTKLCDDLLFVKPSPSGCVDYDTVYRCIHIPSLVISTQLPGGSLSLTENAFSVLLPKCTMEARAASSTCSVNAEIYSLPTIPTSPSTHPRYCFILKRLLWESRRVDWEILEVEIDMSVPGPIKIFSRVSPQHIVQRPTYPARPLHDNDKDLLLYLPLRHGYLPRASLSVQFLRVGKPGKRGVAKLEGVEKMRLSVLRVDRDAGYVIIWAAEDWPGWTRESSFIWWLGERTHGNMVSPRTKELILGWSRGLLKRF